MLNFLFLVIAVSIASGYSFGSSDEKFIKKYALMKVDESCLGTEVAKQIRKELKAACAKCAAASDHQGDSPAPAPSRPVPTQLPPGITDPENSVYANQQAFDPEKLHHAILAYRPNMAASSFRPYAGPSPNFYSGGFPPSPYYPAYPQPLPFAGMPYGLPYFGQQFYGSQRNARGMDIREQLEILTSKVSGRVRNVTCVLQELGYLDENLRPNYAGINERIGNLPVPEELRKDMQDGVEFCRQFSQCVPEVKIEKSPLSRDLLNPMFFFKCYKLKKLEACIMKDVREKFSIVSEDDFEGSELEFRRTGKSKKLQESETDSLVSEIYDFLHGGESWDSQSFI